MTNLNNPTAAHPHAWCHIEHCDDSLPSTEHRSTPIEVVSEDGTKFLLGLSQVADPDIAELYQTGTAPHAWLEVSQCDMAVVVGRISAEKAREIAGELVRLADELDATVPVLRVV